jgi:sterol desaturase/sphingolipid hydroxylase (fatty acid hydroxylase superfamily)
MSHALPPYVFAIIVPLFFGLIVWEMVMYRRQGRPFPFAEGLVSLVVASANQMANFGGAYLTRPISSWVYEHRIFTIPMDRWWSWVLLFLGLEFFYYWMHRAGHEIRWMWASHSVHHSPVTITFSGAYRLSVTSVVSGLFLFFLPLSWLGFPPKAVALMFSINLLYQFWLHTDQIKRLGWFEKWFNTPSHHRVHHAMEDIYLDRNHGGILIIFDKMFGTFQEERDDVPLTYGLIGKKATMNPLRVLFQEWQAIFADVRRARTPWTALRLLFGTPKNAAGLVEDSTRVQAPGSALLEPWLAPSGAVPLKTPRSCTDR